MVSRSRSVYRSLRFAVLLAIWATALAPVGTSQASEDDAAPDSKSTFVVIVHPSVELDSVDERMLREVALGKVRYWKPGQPIQLIIESGGNTRDIWTRDLARMNSAQFTQYWMGLAFQGRATIGPRVVPDVLTAVSIVGALPGSIAIVPSDRVSPQVRVVSVSNRSSGELGQKLR